MFQILVVEDSKNTARLMKAVLKRAGYEVHEAGNGLGLTIVKKIIDLHGGHISVCSSKNGSTFEVILNNK